jgi:hypothetical protein
MTFRPTLTGRNSTTLKSHNLQAILLALLQHQHISRVDLAEITGLSNTTITNLVTELIEQGIAIEEGSAAPKKRVGAGRPRKALCLIPDARLTIGIHIGVGYIRIALTDLRANILDFHALTHPLEKSTGEVLEDIVLATRQLIRSNEISLKNIIWRRSRSVRSG